jgi:hypothetical protein
VAHVTQRNGYTSGQNTHQNPKSPTNAKVRLSPKTAQIKIETLPPHELFRESLPGESLPGMLIGEASPDPAMVNRIR